MSIGKIYRIVVIVLGIIFGISLYVTLAHRMSSEFEGLMLSLIMGYGLPNVLLIWVGFPIGWRLFRSIRESALEVGDMGIYIVILFLSVIAGIVTTYISVPIAIYQIFTKD